MTTKAQRAAYSEETRAKLAATQAVWVNANRDHIKAYQTAYRVKNAVKRKAYSDANKERFKEWYRVYCSTEEGREVRRRSRAAANHNRRARKNAVKGNLSSDIIPALLQKQKGKCVCCKGDLFSIGYHLDHIMPLALGGLNVKQNVQLLCPPCNMAKGAKHPVEFMQQRGFLL